MAADSTYRLAHLMRCIDQLAGRTSEAGRMLSIAQGGERDVNE